MVSRSFATVALAFAFLASLPLGACTKAPSTGHDVAWASCRLKGIEIALRCADVTVPENRAQPDGRKIALRVAVVPALARRPEPDAIFVLAGGPGQSATDIAGTVFPLFAKLNRERDVVFVDQRGTGASHPLSCEPETKRMGLAASLDESTIATSIAACATRLAKDADLTQFTTSIAMRDLDDVRARLGYPQVDLWGGSYGTRAALEYVRQFPARVRSMTIDGVAPAWQKLPLSFGTDTYATLAGLVADCRADASCNRRYPDLDRDVDRLLAALSGPALEADVTGPLDGRRVHVKLTPVALAQLLRTPLYSSLTASVLPAAIDAAAHGDFDGLAGLLQAVGGGLEQHLALGMHLSVVCAEDVPAITTDERARAKAEHAKSALDGRPNPFAELYLDQYDGFCRGWPRGTPAPGYFDTLAGKPGANVPTLLLSGGIDPATPPAHAAEVAKVLTRAKHLVAPHLGHGVSLQGCTPDVVSKFIRSADPSSVDGACLATIPRPLFEEGIRAGTADAEKGPLP